MITQSFPFIVVMVLVPGIVLYIDKTYSPKLFKYLPPMMMIFLGSMTLYTLGLWEMSPEINATRNAFRQNMIPVMIFFMCLQCDMRKVIGLGPRLIATFVTATFSIAMGYIIIFFLFHPVLGGEIGSTFGAMLAGWTGGTQNFLAVKAALNISDEMMARTLLMGSLNYSLWVLILVMIKPFKDTFNRWTKTDTSGIEAIADKIVLEDGKEPQFNYVDLLFSLGLGLVVSWLCLSLGKFFGQLNLFFAESIWTIILATFLGLFLAPTKLTQLKGYKTISNMILFIILFLVSSNVNLVELLRSPLYVLAGSCILIIHAIILALFAKLFKWDLYTCAVASLANVGGVTSAPILAATYHKSLVSISILMSMLGVVLGTFVGLGVGSFLQGF